MNVATLMPDCERLLVWRALGEMERVIGLIFQPVGVYWVLIILLSWGQSGALAPGPEKRHRAHPRA